jgi:hypothetical protein
VTRDERGNVLQKLLATLACVGLAAWRLAGGFCKTAE